MTEIMIAMRDGVRLQTFVSLPTAEDRYPCLLARCTYGTDIVSEQARRFVDSGFAVVTQNVRGRHGSEGTLTSPFANGEDGFDTLDWIVAQPWCNGRVGTFGRSALAILQTTTALLGHPAHRAMCPQVLPYAPMRRLGGSFLLHQVPLWYYRAWSGPELNPYETIDWMPHLYKLPVTSILDDVDGPKERYRSAVTQMRSEMEYADPRSFAKLNTPTLLVTGWYDHSSAGAIDFFLHTQTYASAEQKRHTHLVIGPWDHRCDPAEIRDYDFGAEAFRDHQEAEVAFFDRHLKQIDSMASPARVRIFVMGRNAWRDESSWPLDRAIDTKFYLHSAGDVRGAWERGSLSEIHPSDEKPDHFTYDPEFPVPSFGGANSGPAQVLPMRRGPRDQRMVLYRDDVLTYYSDILEKPLEVTGPIILVLYAATSARDTDFTAKLMDVLADGNARLLSDGVVRARYRNGISNPELAEPNQPVRYEIDLWQTSNEFQRGHRIALAISSSNFPRLSRNLNTGGDNERDKHYLVAEQTVFHDAQHPSHLILPVVPPS